MLQTHFGPNFIECQQFAQVSLMLSLSFSPSVSVCVSSMHKLTDAKVNFRSKIPFSPLTNNADKDARFEGNC